jgi:hypothetical protein
MVAEDITHGARRGPSSDPIATLNEIHRSYPIIPAEKDRCYVGCHATGASKGDTKMNWGKRTLSDIEDFGRYHEQLLKLLYSNPGRYQEFMMVTTKTEDPASRMYFVGVPPEVPTGAFEGFEYVSDEELPKEIDSVIVAAVESEEFTSRFRYRAKTLAAGASAFSR